MARILIVDDDAHIVAVMSLWLTQHGYDIVEAANGAEALETLGETSVDLIISDVNMPQMDGLAFARAVRDQRGLQTPFLMLSSRCDQTSLAKEMEPYDVELFPKPFMPSRLVAAIDRRLRVVTT